MDMPLIENCDQSPPGKLAALGAGTLLQPCTDPTSGQAGPGTKTKSSLNKAGVNVQLISACHSCTVEY